MKLVTKLVFKSKKLFEETKEINPIIEFPNPRKEVKKNMGEKCPHWTCSRVYADEVGKDDYWQCEVCEAKFKLNKMEEF